jgi:hypothetical protein
VLRVAEDPRSLQAYVTPEFVLRGRALPPRPNVTFGSARRLVLLQVPPVESVIFN